MMICNHHPNNTECGAFELMLLLMIIIVLTVHSAIIISPWSLFLRDACCVGVQHSRILFVSEE